jgi:HSP20 family protein
MFGPTRSNSFDDFFTFQREVDRLFNQFWADLPSRRSTNSPGLIQVNTGEDGWRIDVPLPGIDPEHVAVEAAGNALTIRVEEPHPANPDTKVTRYEQALTIPPFLDVDKLSASHRHGLLQLTLPLKESLKPRRIRVEHGAESQKHVEPQAQDKKQLSAV